MGKAHDTHRGDLMRRIAELQARLDELLKSAPSAERVKQQRELEQAIANLKKQVMQ